jgi:hypothetical protein
MQRMMIDITVCELASMRRIACEAILKQIYGR